ncbi:MAG: S-adenosylmethionine:tRNA ribosyltransferase-isomerase, partial [Rhodospirillales bacterium]|nr:S-adenosylmethionine:tRNA ribosyltransferase-isomerase [Rhodospirillales bacterium]
METAEFDFHLPARLIAQRPASPRDGARLLHVSDTLGDFGVRDLPELLDEGDLLVFNDTKVLPSRLAGKRGEAGIEVTLHKNGGGEAWWAFAKPARRLKPGDLIRFAPGLAAKVLQKKDGGEVELEFDLDAPALASALEAHGQMPLPPYIKRPKGGEQADRADYQTMFAQQPGAVAAPTAGLHFTPSLMEALAAKGVGHVFVTLHVGAGTFLPVKVARTEDHIMQAEWGELDQASARRINQTHENGKRVVAVGSTSLRLLETAAMDDGSAAAYRGET